MEFHFSAKQATLLATAVCNRYNNELHHQLFTVISDWMAHVTSAVETFNSKILDHLKVELHMKHAHDWSDGAVSQFKSKYNLNLLTFHEEGYETMNQLPIGLPLDPTMIKVQ